MRRTPSGLRTEGANAEGWERIPASDVLSWRRELDASWTPVHVVVAAVALLFGRNQPARVVEFVGADAEIQGRAEPPAAMRYRTSPAQSQLLKLAMVQAETWRGSMAPVLSKRLLVPGGAAVESALP